MLEHIASQVDPFWGILAVVLAGLAITAIIIQMVVVKKSVWDEHAQIALDDENTQTKK